MYVHTVLQKRIKITAVTNVQNDYKKSMSDWSVKAMKLEDFWEQISVAVEYCNTCDICPVKIFANETGTEFICCDMNCDCAEGLMVLHKKLQEEELKMIKREESKRKKSVYRFWVCKHGNPKLNEFIPVTDPFYTLNEANEWMIKHSSGTDEILYAIQADKDMWDDEDIERLEREEDGSEND